MRMGVEGPKRQAYDKGKMRERSSLASSCSSWAVSQKKELFLTDVSESAVISQCSIWQVLSLKLEGVEENQPCGVRNGVLQDLFFWSSSEGWRCSFRGLYTWKYVCKVVRSPTRLSNERGEGTGGRSTVLGSGGKVQCVLHHLHRSPAAMK